MIEHLSSKSQSIFGPLNKAWQSLPCYASEQWQQQHSFSALNQQYLLILFHPVISRANGNEKVIHLDYFNKPETRSAFLRELNPKLQRLQQMRKQYSNNHELLKQFNQLVSLDTYLPELLKKAPLALFYGQQQNLQQTTINHSADAAKQLDALHFQALCITALFYCFIASSDELNKLYFFQVLEQAVISLCIAQQYQEQPLNNFIACLIHSLSLIAIKQELESLNSSNWSNCSQSAIVLAAANLLPKLDYWLAKDLGLTDEILYYLKHKYQHDDPPYSNKALLLGEYGHQCIQLYQHKVLGKKELRFLLHKIDGLAPSYCQQQA
jgi:hypothetical protein